MDIMISKTLTENIKETEHQAEDFKHLFTDEKLLQEFIFQTGTENNIIRGFNIMYCNLSPTYIKEEKKNQYHVEIGIKNYDFEFNVIEFYIDQYGTVKNEKHFFDIEYYTMKNRISDNEQEEEKYIDVYSGRVYTKSMLLKQFNSLRKSDPINYNHNSFSEYLFEQMFKNGGTLGEF